MSVIRAFKALGPVDARNIRRDSMLRWFFLFPFLIALAVSFLVPFLAQILLERTGFDLSAYYPLILSFLFPVMPLLVGMVLGFLLLDQRDDQTLTALQVTPLSINGYLIYRLSVPLLISTVLTIVIIPLCNLGTVQFPALIATALANAPLAPILAIFYATFARNKVQGFAVMKGSGVILVPPLVAYFVHSGWQWAFGVIPTFWPVKMFWLLQAHDPLGWILLPIALLIEGGILWTLIKRFNRVMTAG